jgi:hypothetical protein
MAVKLSRDSCQPAWFAEGEYPGGNGSRFPAEHLNLVARVVYAEAAGSAIGGTDAERLRIAGVIFNRLRRPEFGSPSTLQEVVNYVRVVRDGKGRTVKKIRAFPAVDGDKFRSSRPGRDGATRLTDRACEDLNAALRAVQAVLRNGPARAALTVG